MKRLPSKLGVILQNVGRRLAKWWKTLRHKLAKRSGRRIIEDVLLLVVVLQLATLGANLINRDRPILGLRFEGQLIGQWANNFRSQTNNIINTYENGQLTVAVAEETSSITLRQLGADIDKEQIYTDLLAEGRGGNLLARLAVQDLATMGFRNVQLQNPNLNSGLANKYIDTLDQKIHRTPENAYFKYEQKVAVHPDKPGRTVDEQAAIAALENADPQHQPHITLPTKQVSAKITESMLNTVLSEAEAIAQKPLTVIAGDSKTTLSPEQLVALIVPKVVPDSKKPDSKIVQLTFDESKLKAVTDEVVDRVVASPKPTIMSGGTVVQQGESGIATQDDNPLSHVLTALIERQTGAASPDEANIPLVKIDPPVVQQVVPRTRTGTGAVSLTFDDGPGGYTDQILDILGRYNVHAVFYVVGRNVPSYAGQMQRTVHEGHTVCNHTYNHPNLTYLSWGGVHQELSSTQAAIQQATGVTPNCFRPPYGAHNQTVRDVASSLGLSLDMWSIDPRDWGSPGSSAITQRVLNNTHSGAVVLLHVLNQQTVNALPSIIEGIRAQGYTLQ
jgi:peptidoglycan-N-acetylglucosamine deacetylase